MAVAATPYLGLLTRSEVPPSCSDAELVELMRDHNTDAFELFYCRHASAALGFATEMVGDPVVAEDITFEAFVAMWRGTHPYHPEQVSVRNWVLATTLDHASHGTERSSPWDDPAYQVV